MLVKCEYNQLAFVVNRKICTTSFVKLEEFIHYSAKEKESKQTRV